MNPAKQDWASLLLPASVDDPYETYGELAHQAADLYRVYKDFSAYQSIFRWPSEHGAMASYFSGFVDFMGEHPLYAFTAVFLLALSEAIPVVGTVVPGSTLIVAISALATGADVNPWFLLVAATVGAIVGDGLSFWLGQRYHGAILLRWPLNRYPRFIDRSRAFINKYGVTSVFLARFTAVVRAFVPLLAGILRMSPRQFYVANILSALVWAPAHVFPGVLLAIALRLTGVSATQLTVLLIAGLIAAWVASRFFPTSWLWKHRRGAR
jgi:membrane protein DedA with SNARE-associated domain